MDDICGRDWVPGAGDHGDPGLMFMIILPLKLPLPQVQRVASYGLLEQTLCRSRASHHRSAKGNRSFHPAGRVRAHAQEPSLWERPEEDDRPWSQPHHIPEWSGCAQGEIRTSDSQLGAKSTRRIGVGSSNLPRLHHRRSLRRARREDLRGLGAGERRQG
jgi:hypothetical protein